MWYKKLRDLYRSAKFEVKYFFRNLPLRKKFKHEHEKKVYLSNKELQNFILARDFMQKFDCGEVEKNLFDYNIDLLIFEDAYFSCYEETAFVNKYGTDGKAYTFKESAGIVRRIDVNDMPIGKPLDLKQNVIEEDEVCLASFFQGNNYWHFTFETLPRLLIMEKRGYKGKYLVNNGNSIREFLAITGFDENRLIFCSPNQVIHAKKVYMIDEFFGIELSGKLLEDTRKFAIERIEANHGCLIDESYPRKIYVSRIGTRRIINENQLTEFLVPRGFKVIVPETVSVLEQIKLFANADIIVTPHGANATNALYCKKGTTLVECFGHYWVNPCMVTTVEMLDLDYRMLCERFMHNIPNTNRFSNYIIDLTMFTCTMNKVFEFREQKIN